MKIILLQITGYGWTAIAMLVLSVLVAVKMLQRSDARRRLGCLSVGYIALIVFCLLLFTAMLSGMLGSFVLHTLQLPRYEARVVDYSAYESKNSDNRRVTMYQPVVVFTTADGQQQRMKTDISSSGKKEPGAYITVLYQPGMDTAEELSGSKYVLIGGACMGLLLMGYLLIAGIAYAMGRSMRPFLKVGMGLLLYLVFPVGMLFLLGGISYALFRYFTGQKPDMPLWAVVLCCFFAFILFFAFIGYIRTLTSRGRRIV